MERRQVLLVDAFADEPMGGQQIPVIPVGGLSQTQLRAVADELSSPGVVGRREDKLVYAGRAGMGIEGAIAGAAGLFGRGDLAAGNHRIGGTEPRQVEIEDDGSVWVESDRQEIETDALGERTIGDALGVDVAAIRDVGADLPVARASGGGGSLLVAVNFFEHLSGADPDLAALGELLRTESLTRVLAFSFDTLAAESDVHARVFTRGTRTESTGRGMAGRAGEQATSGVTAAALGTHLTHHDVFDEGPIRIECGHVLGRPATMWTTLEAAPTVGGRGVTTVDGEMTVPADDPDEDIIEA